MLTSCAAGSEKPVAFFSADHSAIQYTGRIDFKNPQSPRFWQPGVNINTVFVGGTCSVIIKDEFIGGVVHNYIEVIVDGKEKRLRLQSATDTIEVASGLSAGNHTLIICKNTEANIGYIEFAGILCDSLIAPNPKPQRKIEFIGNSITSGTGSDQSAIPCGKGRWEDQHNAWLSYGAIAARALNAQYHLSSVSGIGLMHSCCGMTITMPEVFDKVHMNQNAIPWNFNNYQPDVITVCLGQNDGIQDSVVFTGKYLAFLRQLRKYYPAATIVCLNSPMADDRLSGVLKAYLSAIVNTIQKEDPKVDKFFFSRRYYHGCDTHPNLEEHKEMAGELTTFLKTKMKW